EVSNADTSQAFDGKTLGEALLEPTRIYVKSVLELISKVQVNALSHITGGGFQENIPRVLPEGTVAVIDESSWNWPEIFNWLQQNGNVDRYEMFRTFNCGVGMVAAIDGEARRQVVEAGIEALKQLWHRGAVDADGKTGDGCGIHLQIPQEFFKDHIRRMGQQPGNGSLAVGQVFLPRTDLSKQERVREIIESEIIGMGHRIYGWRQVPVHIGVIGTKANATRPEIEQILVENALDVDDNQFEVDLYIIRRRIEKAVLAENLTEAYICSLSCRSVIYKGLFLAEELTAFYPDLLDEKFVSNFVIYHQRYSTNTFPSWPLAQPFRILAHNGEINTLLGNVNWMKSHETRMDDPVFGDHVEDIKPIVQPDSSDSSALDAVFEVLVRTKRELPEVKSLLMPEAWENSNAVPQNHKDFYAYANSVMEPWDG
ncbi:MAG: AIR synthase-related protein, partial [Alphaproteobacteria bacterium]|nr:AIR synthase-related protein [Alphaproteobacteria bacterium]